MGRDTMLRILQAVNVMDRAGLETMLMNYYRNVDRNEIQFDFLTHRPDIGAYEDEILSMGGNVYHAPRLYPQNYKSYFRYMRELFSEHKEYQIIHAHIDTMSAFPLMAAKKNGIPVRIAHSHSSKLDRDAKLPIKYVAKLAVPEVANQYFACGNKAGKFLYGKNAQFKVIHNAVDLGKFGFDEALRQNNRKKLGIEQGGFVIGHVGRYCYIKNQLFLLEIFEKILAIKPNSYLLLIGKGEDEKKLRKFVSERNLDNRVMFLIDRSDVHELYQTMDVFVMPSLFEGLPVVGVEAQANGLPCFFSENISDEVVLTTSAMRVSLNNNTDEWARTILGLSSGRNDKAAEQLTKAGYNIKKEAKKLSENYLKLWKAYVK